MLILALMMVLFANYMDERLADGKKVIRCDLHRARMGSSDKEKEPLLVNSTKEGEEEPADYYTAPG